MDEEEDALRREESVSRRVEKGVWSRSGGNRRKRVYDSVRWWQQNEVEKLGAHCDAITIVDPELGLGFQAFMCWDWSCLSGLKIEHGRRRDFEFRSQRKEGNEVLFVGRGTGTVKERVCGLWESLNCRRVSLLFVWVF